MSVTAAERSKYEKIWAIPEYSNHSPGEHFADLFMDVTEAKAGDHVIDLGAGSGKGAVALAAEGLVPVLVDLTPDGLVEEARAFPFVQASLWGEWWPEAFWKLESDAPVFGYCCDVMEHIPTEYTMLAAKAMIMSCKGGVFFAINFLPDNFGQKIGESLHLTVKPFTWWRDRLAELGELVTARDLLGQGVFFVRRG